MSRRETQPTGHGQINMKPLRIFISSVQKELELERAAVAALIATDPFLLAHCVPVLFEKEPPPPRPARKPYLEALKGCQAYVLMIANEYGKPDGDISATHHEYRTAQKLKLPTIVFLKGAKDDARSREVQALISETKKDGYTYKRFHDREDLKPLMLAALQRMLAEEFKIRASAAEVTEGEQLIEHGAHGLGLGCWPVRLGLFGGDELSDLFEFDDVGPVADNPVASCVLGAHGSGEELVHLG